MLQGEETAISLENSYRLRKEAVKFLQGLKYQIKALITDMKIDPIKLSQLTTMRITFPKEISFITKRLSLLLETFLV